MKVYPDVDFHTKTGNHRETVQKTSEKGKKTTYWKQKNAEYSKPRLIRILAKTGSNHWYSISRWTYRSWHAAAPRFQSINQSWVCVCGVLSL